MFDQPVHLLEDVHFLTRLFQVLVGAVLLVGTGFLSRQINRFRDRGYPAKPNAHEPTNESPPAP